MGEMMQNVQHKVHKSWSLTKRVVTLLSLWGLVFSLVTIGRFQAAFDYDDTLVFSAPAFQKAFRSGTPPFSSQFWGVVNQSYELEKRKLLPVAVAWLLRACGFRVSILVERPADGGEPLRKEWRRLTSQFYFTPTPALKRARLGQGQYVLYFGDSDSDIREGRAARVLPIRVQRSPRSPQKEDYHPGSLGEWVFPLSRY